MNETLEQLASSTGFPRISIYIPTHPTFPDWEQDPIRFANAVRKAAAELEEAGHSSEEIDALFGEARARGKMHEFWRYQDKGLAVFIEPGATRWVKLPAEPPERTIVAATYHVRPALRVLRDPGGFNVLTVSRDGARFFNGAADALQEISIEGVPEGVGEIRGRTEFDADVGYHSRGGASSERGGDAPKYAALGESPDDYDETILEVYTQGVAKAVDRHMNGSRAPLAVVALPRTLGRLKHHLDYREALFDNDAIDPQSLDPKALHKHALGVVGPRLNEERETLRERLRAALGGAGAAHETSLQNILKAAEEGRVETVFLAVGKTVWGHYDAAHRAARIDSESGPENEDLLNLAALKTLATGGDVRTLPEDLADDIGPIAALMRY